MLAKSQKKNSLECNKHNGEEPARLPNSPKKISSAYVKCEKENSDRSLSKNKLIKENQNSFKGSMTPNNKQNQNFGKVIDAKQKKI